MGSEGIPSLIQALKSNTTLTKLDLGREENVIIHRERHSSFQSIFHYKSTDNQVNASMATQLSEVLKTNTTLTQLDMCCEYKRRYI